jgi:AcrR family transcriptional regulator
MQDVDGRPLRADARQNRERILAAARDVFVEQGAGAPLEEISRRAGTGIATLYRRFPDRRALMRAVVLDSLAHTTGEARSAAEEEPDAFRALTRYMHRALDIRVAAVIPALLEEISMADSEIDAASDEGARMIQELIDAAKREGTLRPDVTFADIGTLIVRLSRPLPGRFTRELNDQLGHRHLDLLINGLRAVPDGAATIEGPALSREELRAFRTPTS